MSFFIWIQRNFTPVRLSYRTHQILALVLTNIYKGLEHNECSLCLVKAGGVVFLLAREAANPDLFTRCLFPRLSAEKESSSDDDDEWYTLTDQPGVEQYQERKEPVGLSLPIVMTVILESAYNPGDLCSCDS